MKTRTLITSAIALPLVFALSSCGGEDSTTKEDSPYGADKVAEGVEEMTDDAVMKTEEAAEEAAETTEDAGEATSDAAEEAGGALLGAAAGGLNNIGEVLEDAADATGDAAESVEEEVNEEQ